MRSTIEALFNDVAGQTRRKIGGIYAVLLVFNLSAWVWAFVAFRHYPALVGTAFLAYSLGLRHAVDADHIAAIDNVTRKLMQDGKRPVGVGVFFSLGHSTIVVVLSLLLALSIKVIKDDISNDSLSANIGIIGTTVSAIFLLLIAAINILVLIDIYKTWRQVARGGTYE